jgi:hypothetical protein
VTEKIHWWMRLNRAIFPIMGPAQLGPFGEPPLPSVQAKPCPLCGVAMADHVVERRDGRPTQLHCPGHLSHRINPDAEGTL